MVVYYCVYNFYERFLEDIFLYVYSKFIIVNYNFKRNLDQFIEECVIEKRIVIIICENIVDIEGQD